MSKFFSDETITQSMLNGLKEGLKIELRERILAEMDNEIEAAVASVVNRLSISANQMISPYDSDRKIRLDVLFMHTNEHKSIQEHTMTIVKDK